MNRVAPGTHLKSERAPSEINCNGIGNALGDTALGGS